MHVTVTIRRVLASSRQQIFLIKGAQQLLLREQRLAFYSDSTPYMQGLAVGFVLLRVEALTEEGKL